MNTQNKGFIGERIAEEYLINKGYTLVERNYRHTRGEIDLIFTKEDCLVFVEVKARKNVDYGYPSDFVTPEKQQRILIAAEFFIKERDLFDYQPVFDVIEVFLEEPLRIEHIEDAFP